MRNAAQHSYSQRVEKRAGKGVLRLPNQACASPKCYSWAPSQETDGGMAARSWVDAAIPRAISEQACSIPALTHVKCVEDSLKHE